ncbi:MAG: MAE_28990/MAE_18760 family HEPN-like nuclease [Desulfuromonadales bacterium]
MIRVQQDFQERINEIEGYFDFVMNIADGNTLLIKKGKDQESAYTSQKQADLVRTFKATAFLLLYNLMESTVSNAVEAIFDELASFSISYDDCRREIKRVVLTNLKQHDVADILPELGSFSIDVVSKTFRKNKIFSGNVDAQKIRKVADEYGFAHPSADGTSLVTIKSSRNDLAHGSKSFAEVGRDYTITELIGMKDKVIAYLHAMLTSVANYISQQQYLTAPGRP